MSSFGTTTTDDPTAPVTFTRPLTDLNHERIKHRPVLGGLINEYERVVPTATAATPALARILRRADAQGFGYLMIGSGGPIGPEPPGRNQGTLGVCRHFL
jgi:hypothetical protein